MCIHVRGLCVCLCDLKCTHLIESVCVCVMIHPLPRYGNCQIPMAEATLTDRYVQYIHILGMRYYAHCIHVYQYMLRMYSTNIISLYVYTLYTVQIRYIFLMRKFT